MEFAFRLYANLAPVAAVSLLVAVAAILPYRREPAGKSLVAYLLLACALVVSNAMELVLPPGERAMLFVRFQYVAFAYIPVAWLSFCLRYTGWITYTRRGLLALALAGPVPVVLAAFTNALHGLLWESVGWVEAGEYSVMRATYGPVFWIVALYSWGLIAFGTVIVFRSYVSGERLFYRQSRWMLAGAILPGVFNLVHVFRILPAVPKDFTPVGFALSGLCFIFAVYFHKLFWIMPVARSVLLQRLDIGILVLDRHDTIVDHNEMADDILGIPSVSVGKDAASFPRLSALLGEVRKARAFGDEEQSETGTLEADGRRVSYTVQTNESNSRMTTITVRDVTEETRLREEMERIKGEFINREKLATVGRITAGLAHEVNNPLAYVDADVRSLELMLERMRDAAGPGERARFDELLSVTAGIGAGVERISAVVGSLLSFSRGGSTSAERTEYDLHEGIDMTLDFLRYELKGSVAVKREYTRIPAVRAVKNEINQVIFNILTNAAHAIRDRGSGDGAIVIRTGHMDDTVWCEIENNGPPIPEDAKTRIFELFYTTKTEKWGTGLGLSLCRDIVEHHHRGLLYLKSCDPVVFRMELPARDPETGDRDASA